jgi:Secretion system C-terminal sorting domain
MPTITITSPTSFVYGSGLTLSVNKGGSTGAVTYSVVNGNGSAYIDQQNSILWSQGAGSVTVTANVASDLNYSGGSVSQLFTITKADPNIIFTSPTYGAYNSTINLTISELTLGDFGPTAVVTYSVNNGSGSATISGSTLSLNSVGFVTVTANLAANNNFNAGSASTRINIGKADQTIVFNQPPTKRYGDPPFQLIATSSSGLPVSFSNTNTSVATIVGNVVTIQGVGTTTIYATQSGNQNYKYAPAVFRTLTVQNSNGARIASEEPQQEHAKNEEPNVEEIIVFPNPAVNQFTVALPERVKEDTPLSFYDMMGKQLISSAIPKGQWKVSVSLENISEGMYLVKIGYGDYGTVKKVMVQR